MDIINSEEFKPLVRYPWHEWLDGQTRVATHGVDFNVQPSIFVAAVRTAAKRRGMIAKVRKDGAKVIFQIIMRTD